MREIEADVAIIGAGTAGLNARREVERAGGRPLLIERGPYGTTCARVGCMPSKLLIAAAEAAHAMHAASLFGVSAVGGVRVDGPAVMRRVQAERDRFAGAVVRSTEATPPDQRIAGAARFIGPTTLIVGEAAQVQARAVVVAAGSAPFVPPPFDATRAQVLTSDEVFELPDLPESLAVTGTGIIALELGQAMRRLGVRVAFFNPFDELGPFTDPEIKEEVRRVLGAELDLRLGTRVASAEPVAGGVAIRWQDAAGGDHAETFARVLVAAGRRPNVAGLGLETTGLALDPRTGLPAMDPATTQCDDAPIFLAGDVDGTPPLQREAADEGRIAGDNAMRWPAVLRRDRRTPMAVAFTDPRMAMVGTAFADLPPGRHAIGAANCAGHGRARTMGVNRGVIRLYGEVGTCRLLGGELFGPGMEHMAHLLGWAVQQGMSVPRGLAMPFYHPTLESGFKSALRNLGGALRALDQ